MVANAIQKRIAVALETGSLAAPAAIDYDAIASPGGLMAVTQADASGLKRARIENKTIPRRASDQPTMIQALRNEAMLNLTAYMAGQTSGHAAAGASATRDLLDLVIRAGWGGEYIGVSADVTGGSAAAPEVTEGQGGSLDDYGWGYFWDASESVGHFRQIASVAVSGGNPDTLTMADGHDLPFVPAAGDRVYAVIAHYVDWDVAENYAAAGHEALRILHRGRDDDDMFELYFAKPEIQFGAVETGQPTELTIPVKCAYFQHDELTIDPSLAQQLQGSPGRVVGAGSTTRAWYANVGAALATQQFWGGIQFTPGVVPDQQTGPNGTEGVHGYGVTGDSYKASRLELTVPFDVQHRTDAEADQAKHFLLQVGNAITSGPWGLYCPRLTWVDDVEVGAEAQSRRSQTLRFQCEEAPDDAAAAGGIDVTGMTDAVVHRARAKFILLRVA